MCYNIMLCSEPAQADHQQHQGYFCFPGLSLSEVGAGEGAQLSSGKQLENDRNENK
jgi:hypothetical protein